MSDPQALLLFVMFLAAIAILVGALVFVTACCYEIAERLERRRARARVRALRGMIGAGLLTWNEARAQLNLPPVPRPSRATRRNGRWAA